jgi:hypothetical protein
MCVPLSLTVSPAGGKPGVCCCRPRSICPSSVVLLRYPVIWQAGKPALRRSAVCDLRSAVHIRLFVSHSLTARPPPAGGKPGVCCCRPRSICPSSVVLLRYPVIWQAGKPALRRSAVCDLRSAVHIRLFVPHSLTARPPDRLKSRPATYLYRPSSTVHRLSCRLPSIFVYSFPIR